MKARLIALLMLVCGTVIFASCILYDDVKKEKILLETIVGNLLNGHYAEHKLDDNFSKDVYNAYIRNLDYSKRFYIQSDIDALDLYKLDVDDQIKTLSFALFDKANSLLDQRVKMVKRYYKTILSEPMDFTKNDSIETDYEKLIWCKDTIALYNYWNRILKFQVITRLSDMMDIQEKAAETKDTSVKILPFDSLEFSSRRKVEKNMDDWFSLLDKTELNDRLAVYMNSIGEVFDPHTEYYVPKDKENFDISMSGKLEGIGATLQQRDGYIRVAEVVVGSPSWLQGELKEGDIILKVAQGNKEPVDVVDMRLDNAVKLIRGKKGTEVRLTVKKVDGIIKIISIIRDIVVLEETFAKSVILNDPKIKKDIGYIFLPKFYVDFSDKTARNCTDDMKKEIEKLKKENAKGLIIDLRNNGGGSLEDVVKIAGLFIKDGPIVQVKGRYGSPYILADTDTAIQYRGPLVILVNQFSASASEILAAAIQDYKRGIILGDSATFGKGTVQRMFDLDNVAPRDAADVKPLGSLKLTVQKFYRVNGGATQLNGVASDVIVPNNYSYLKIGEREQSHYIPWDEILPVKYTVWNNPCTNLNKVIEKSKKRVSSSSAFQLIVDNSKRLKAQRDISVYSLNLVHFRDDLKKQKTDSKKYEEIMKNETGVVVRSLTDDEAELKASEEKKKKADKWHEGLKKDIYLQEALSVISDMTN